MYGGVIYNILDVRGLIPQKKLLEKIKIKLVFREHSFYYKLKTKLIIWKSDILAKFKYCLKHKKVNSLNYGSFLKKTAVKGTVGCIKECRCPIHYGIVKNEEDIVVFLS